MSATPPGADVAQRILDGQAPQNICSAAARGALPLSRTVLVRLYLHLRGHEDPGVAAEAEQSLEGLSREVVQQVLSDAECAPEVLDHFARDAVKDEAMAEQIAFHRAVPDSALQTLATSGSAEVIDLVLTNQERLLSQPDLLSRLSLNPSLRAVQRGRILELLQRATEAAAQADEDGAEQAPEGEEVSEEIREAARVLQLDIGELYAASEILGGEELEFSDDEAIRNAYQRILTLNVAQKAILAMRGGREERMILVRDTNKLVALGVLRNPRIQEDDIEAIARMRQVTDEVLRQISQNRSWTKNYTIVTALVNNPRTPQGLSTNFVPRLQTQHLKVLAGNREVPELIRHMAKRTLDIRTQRRQGSPRGR